LGVYLYIGRDGEKGAELRATATRQRHLDNLADLTQAGRVVFAGPLKREDGAPCGSIILFNAESFEEARKIADSDPYWTEGVFEGMEVFESMQVLP